MPWWHGLVSENPSRLRLRTRPLDRLFQLFNETFRHIDIKYDRNKRQMVCERAGSFYPPTSLSDGEKQVLCLYAEMVVSFGTELRNPD